LTQAELFELHTSIEVFQSTFQQLVITNQSAKDARKVFEDNVDDEFETALGQVITGCIAKAARQAIKDKIDKNAIKAIKTGGITTPLRSEY
jgi:predicted histidine transporter YuiF (NhaC family)